MRSNDNAPDTRVYDLAERTAKFGEDVIQFSLGIKGNSVTFPLIRQLVRSATSIGANYVEADEAGSKREFRYRISVCKRETRETQYWLRMVVAAAPEHAEVARAFWKEASELVLIFGAIHRRSKDPRA
jgi:four helix bundle protein